MAETTKRAYTYVYGRLVGEASYCRLSCCQPHFIAWLVATGTKTLPLNCLKRSKEDGCNQLESGLSYAAV
jgi:hypothetical protein